MKNTILAVCLFITSPIFGQNFKPVTMSVGFDITSSKITQEGSIKIEGKDFTVFKTASGSKFIKAQGKKGLYPLWIGEPTNQTANFNGKPVEIRKSKNGGLFILILKDGNPRIVRGLVE